jgi:tRNA pseudouridine55 synthase
MNGVLVVDKPLGLTSHDVVAAARRALKERAIGHTGTLDPLATGVLPLACGKATRLVRFLTASEKTYEAQIRFGTATNSYDLAGEVTNTSPERPGRPELEAALAATLGEQLQTPPVFSAKRIDGRRAYELARQDLPVAMVPARVTIVACELLGWTGEEATVRLTCSAGFYVRSFAHDLGLALGSCACLAGLRRTHAGAFTLDQAVTMETLVGGAAEAAVAPALVAAIIPLAQLLPGVPAVGVLPEAMSRVRNGRYLEPHHVQPVATPVPNRPAGPSDPERVWPPAWTRLLNPEGDLIGMAQPGPVPGSLHPAVVLI